MARTPLPGTDFSGKILKKVSYTHDAMIDEIIANPGISEIELAELFGFSKAWVTRLICSDAFQARLALRKGELIDPKLAATAEERFRHGEMLALDIVAEKLEVTKDAKLAMQFLNMTSKARAYGARAATPGVVNNNFVVALPPVAQSAEQWQKDVTNRTQRIERGDSE